MPAKWPFLLMARLPPIFLGKSFSGFRRLFDFAVLLPVFAAFEAMMPRELDAISRCRRLLFIADFIFKFRWLISALQRIIAGHDTLLMRGRLMIGASFDDAERQRRFKICFCIER